MFEQSAAGTRVSFVISHAFSGGRSLSIFLLSLTQATYRCVIASSSPLLSSSSPFLPAMSRKEKAQEQAERLRNASEKIKRKNQALVNRVLARHKKFPLQLVTWRTILKPGWREALQRMLPFTALLLFLAPFTTVQSDSWCLARSRGGYLSAWDGPTWNSL